MTKSINTKPVIVIVDNSIAITGALKSIVNSVSCLSHEFQFVLVLPKHSLAKDYVVQQGLTVYELPFVEIGKSLKKLLMYIPYLLYNSFKLKRIVANHKASIIHMNDFYNMTGLGARLLGAKISVLTHVRFLPDKFMPVLSKSWAWINLRYANKIICVSQAVYRFFPPNNKVEIISDSIPNSENHPPKVISQKQTDEVRILYLSNFIQGKGQDYALQSFKIAYEKLKNIRLVFIGGDMGLEKNKAFKKNLEAEVASEGLENVIHFAPFIHDVEAEIKKADILINFSESESFSMTCLDALFYGTPLIATDCGGPAELFENGKSGYLVPNKDVPAMAVAIIELATNITLRQRFSVEGRMFVSEKFSLEKNYLKLQKAYNNALYSNA